ncbi:dynamin family protein [Rossellomorea vietnamensis]|uniref:dynamin family protein n=1 Tax=Rossellomorea vietnamensis TaxID=218284 RepID=UPI00077C1E8E|nr:dynamin family protein [Rossellomorea vietnamensis]
MSSLKLTEYENKKQIILEQLNSIKVIAEDLKMSTIFRKTVETIEQLENDAFLLTIVGEFSRGKSMFINSLIGEKVLPSKVKPTTAILNKIVSSENSYIRLHYHGGVKDPLDITTKELRALSVPDEPDEDDADEIAEYGEKVSKIREIEYAEIGTSAEICASGVEIYDTPGVNDLEQAREDITFKFIPKSDAVILLLTAEAPLSKTEKGFLKEKILDADISKVFIAVNFKDILGGIEEEARIKEYVRKNLNNILRDPKVFMISAREALNLRKELLDSMEREDIEEKLVETGVPALENELGRFFQEERGNVKLLKPLKRGMKFSTDLIEGSLSLKIQTLSMEREEVLKKIGMLLPRVDEFYKNGSRIKNELRANLKGEEGTLKDLIYKYMDRMLAEIQSQLPNFQGEINKERINSFIASIMNPIQKEMQQQIREATQEIFDKHCQAAYRKLESETKRLDDQVKESFSLSLDLNGLNMEGFDEAGVLVALGSFGLGAFGLLIAAPILIVPLAIFSFLGIGGFVTTAIQAQRRKQLDNVSDSIYTKFQSHRKESAAAVMKEWEGITRSVLDDFEADIQAKATSIREELDGLVELKRNEQVKIEEQKAYYEDQKLELMEVYRHLSMMSRIIQTNETDKKEQDYELV